MRGATLSVTATATHVDAVATGCLGVLVMAEDPLLRDCLGTALAAQRELALAGTGSALTRWPAEVVRDDVTAVVADLGTGAGLVPVVLHVLRDATAGMPLVLLLDDPGDDFVAMVARIGIEGFVGRRSPLDTVLRAIRTVARGGTFVDPGIVGSGRLREAPVSPLAELTLAERRVLALLQTGLSNTQIARSLDRSVNTVKSQVSSTLRKLEVASRVEAALIYQRSNLGTGEGPTR